MKRKREGSGVWSEWISLLVSEIVQRSYLSGQLSNKEKHMYEYAMREIRNGLHDQEPSRMPASLHGVRPHDIATSLVHAAAFVSLFDRLSSGLQVRRPKP